MSQPFDQSRLNQIASNKLRELGLAPAIGDDGKVHADLPLQSYGVTNPFTNNAIVSSSFVVESHDWLRFTSPPLLAALSPIQYYQLNDWLPLVEHVQQLLNYRKKSVDRLATHLHHFQLDARIDGEHGAVVAAVMLSGSGDSVVLIGDEQGVRASHLRPADGGPNQPLPAAAIELAEFADASDLVRFLTTLASRAHQLPDDFAPPKTGEYRPLPGFDSPQANAPAPVSMGAGKNEDSAAPERDDREWMPSTNAFHAPTPGGAPGRAPLPTTVTAGMLARCFGDAAQLAQGVAVLRTWQIGDQRIKLTLKQKHGRRFVGRISDHNDTTLWGGELDVDKHPTMDEFVYHLLEARGLDVSGLRSGEEDLEAVDREPTQPDAEPAGMPESAPQEVPANSNEWKPQPSSETQVVATTPRVAPKPSATPGGEPLPTPGEVWMMKVIVERTDADEVRYSALNADGEPYGAARILPRANFEEVFVEHQGAWRLLVRVLAGSPQQIAYVQLDPGYQPSGETRSIAPAIFLANFLPDADAP